ncbi:MAG: serine/threonine-protein kinase [Nannocystaceae bacterium]
MSQSKIPKLLGLGLGRGRAKRPQLDVVDGGKAVKEHDKLSESLAQTQASGDTRTSGEVDRAISLARTMAATGDAARETGGDAIKETGPASFAATVAPAGDLAPAPEPALADSTPALMRTMAATADELTDSAKRSAGAASGLENSLARTMIASDPGASGSLEAEALDAESVGFARTITPQDAARSQGSQGSRGSQDSRPSLRRDEAITDDPELGKRVLAPEGDDRRLKDMIRARLFRKKAAPVKIGRYTILDRLGEGGMGVVYTAYDDKLERKVAIKVMRSEGEGDSNGRTRLVREAQAMARLSHPNIVTVHEVGEVDGQIFVAMEFVRGQSLDFWQREARPWREVVDVYVRAGRGLAAAHAAGIIHRDFKPHNVLLGDDGAVKVLDFGLARSMGQLTGEVPEEEKALARSEERGLSLLDQRLTRTGAIMGTPAYMAPEQHQGLDATAKSDQFSLCVALYEGLYGELPFEATSLAALIAAVVEGAIKEPPSAAKVPSWVRKVVLRGLAVDPDVRYPTVADLLAALGRDPVARRNRWLATAGFAVLVGGAGFGLASVGAAEAPMCVDAEQEIAAVWGDDARAAVEASLKGTGVAFAGETWEKVAPKLDAYAADWAAMRTEACESHRSGKHSDRLYDLQTACLDQHMAEFRGLVTVFGGIKADEVPNVVQAASGLSPVSRCGDTKSLTEDVAPPDDPRVAAAVDDARIELARVRALALAGRYDDARLALETLAPLDYAPLAAERSLLRGTIELDAGHGDAAIGPLKDALWGALAVGHDRVALDAVNKQLFVKSVYLGDAEGALSDYSLAEALLRRSGDPARARGELENNIGVVYEDLGRFADAKASYQRAIDDRSAALGERHYEVAYSLANLGLLLCHEQRYDLAIEPLSRSLATMAAALGEHHPHTSSALLNTAIAYRGAGRLGEALAATNQALSALADSSGSGSSLYQLGLNMRGRLNVDRRDFARAIDDYEALLRAAQGGSSDLQSEAHAALARAYAGTQDLDKAREHGQAALDLAQGGNPSPRYLAHALDWSGVTSLAVGDPTTAAAHLERSLAIQAESQEADAPPAVFALEHLARAQLALARYDDAAASLTRARAIVDAELPERSQLTAQVRRTEADLALARGDAAAAVEHARAALVIHEATRDADDGELALSRFTLARALRAADPASGEAGELARIALATLREGGDGWAPEAASIDAWLKG